MVNPEEVHDGETYGGGYVYRMSYPSVALLTAIAEDLAQRPLHGTPWFPKPLVSDPDLCSVFISAHLLLEAQGDQLEREERLHHAFSQALIRHSEVKPKTSSHREPGPIRRICDFLQAHYADDIDLETLTKLSGLSRHHLIRAFKKEMRQTPHSYLTDLRVRNARRLLAAGAPPSEVSLACGFYDQSHLNRHFKARMGVTPGVFRARL